VRISLGQLSIDGFDDDVLDQLSGSSNQEYVIVHDYFPRISRTKIQMSHSPPVTSVNMQSSMKAQKP